MEIDIRKIKSYVISVKDAIDRKKHMINVMSMIGFENWSFFDAINVKNKYPYWVGTGLSNYLLLQEAEYPCIVFEDDVAPTEWGREKINIPMDGLTYLGLSSWGIKSGKSEHMGVEFKYHDNEVCIVKHMLSQHAIFYPSKEIAEKFYSNTIRHIFEDPTTTANDELWAKMQTKYTTYALMRPLFYQHCPRNNQYTYFKVT
jgi:GR25 family glycosyltransferase involved in LPS biosynthesis